MTRPVASSTIIVETTWAPDGPTVVRIGRPYGSYRRSVTNAVVVLRMVLSRLAALPETSYPKVSRSEGWPATAGSCVFHSWPLER